MSEHMVTSTPAPEHRDDTRVEAQFIEMHGRKWTALEMAGSPIKFMLDLPEERLLALPEFGADKLPLSEQAKADATLMRLCVATMRNAVR